MADIEALEKQLANLKTTAAYLQGRKKGAWGLITKADQQRQTAISNLTAKISLLKKQ